MLDIQRLRMPVERRLELSPIIRPQQMDVEREPVSHLVQEPDCGALIAPIVDFKNPDEGAIIDGGELVERFAGPRDTLQELNIYLQAMARLGLFVTYLALFMWLVLLT